MSTSMLGIVKKGGTAVLLLFLVVSLVVVSVPEVKALTSYTFYGCFTEWGIGETDHTYGIAFMEGEQPVRFSLNATIMTVWESGVPQNYTLPHLFNATDQAISFSFELGYNTSRIYYTINGAAEDIYVIIPYTTELWNTYTFYVIDYIGLDWGYLEMSLPINGTETEIERWDINTLTDISLTMVWGKTYNLNLVTNLGSYSLPTFTAGATQEKTIAITSEMLYTPPDDTDNVTMTASRDETSNKLSFYFNNDYADTDYFRIELYELGNSTAVWTYQVNSTDTVSTYYAYSEAIDYTAIMSCNTTTFGIMTRTVALLYDPTTDQEAYDNHPFAFLRNIGNLPFDAAQIPAVAILLVLGFTFAWYHLEWGIIVILLVTAVMVAFGWLLISWSWMGVVGSIGFLLLLSERKSKETG